MLLLLYHTSLETFEGQDVCKLVGHYVSSYTGNMNRASKNSRGGERTFMGSFS